MDVVERRSGAKEWLIILLFVLSSVVACPQKTRQNGLSRPASDSTAGPGSSDKLNSDGGWDTGGGQRILSSRELVKRTIEMAQEIAGGMTKDSNVFKDFLVRHAWFSRSRLGLNTLLLLPNYTDQNLHANLPGEKIYFSPALDAFSKKKITYLERGDCPKDPSETAADASVTSHDLGGTVCFSLGNLSQVAPSDLTREVFGLAIHESVHLAGGDEKQAKLFQNAFVEYFGFRFGEMLGASYLDSTTTQLNEALIDWGKARAILKHNMDASLVYARAAKVFGTLKAIQSFDDPIALRIRLAPRDPSVVEEFTSILKRHLGKINSVFLKDFENKTLGPDELKQTIDDLYDENNEIFQIWIRLEKESLCDSEGYFIVAPSSQWLSDICKVRSS